MLQCLEVLGKDRATIKDILDLGEATGVKSVGWDTTDAPGADTGVKSVGWDVADGAGGSRRCEECGLRCDRCNSHR